MTALVVGFFSRPVASPPGARLHWHSASHRAARLPIPPISPGAGHGHLQSSRIPRTFRNPLRRRVPPSGPVPSAWPRRSRSRPTAGRQASRRCRRRPRPRDEPRRRLPGKNNCEITTVCDCDEAVIGKAMNRIEKKQGKAPAYEKDIRKVVENKDIDIISIATPNHWHALAAVWAMQNGKDVYCEKPATHNVREGAIMTAAARKYKPHLPGRHAEPQQPRHARGDRVRAAAARSARSIWPSACATSGGRASASWSKQGEQKPPKTMDYDLWCGPAPSSCRSARPATAPCTTTGTGSGTTATATSATRASTRWTRPAGGWARRQCRRPCSASAAASATSTTARPPTRNSASSTTATDKLIFEVRGLPTEDYKGAKVGNIWVGSDGYVVCPNYAGGIAYDKAGKEVTRFGWDAKQKNVRRQRPAPLRQLRQGRPQPQDART